jgi:AbrB family looped-hinge helix DNA binding protein
MINPQGQITIPPAVREALHLHEGDRADFIIEAEGAVRLVPVTTSITELKGILPPAECVISLEEMDEIICFSILDI